MASPLAVVLLSGGMDSCVTAAVARAEGCRLALFHSDYGQRTEARERRAFEEIAACYEALDNEPQDRQATSYDPQAAGRDPQATSRTPPAAGRTPQATGHEPPATGYQPPAARRIPRLVVNQRYFAQIGGSSLTDAAVPVSPADLESKEIPTSYVPFRNAHFLSAAVSWAEVLGAGRIYLGAVAADSSGYPDCRPAYYRAFQQLVRAGTKPATEIEIRTPLISLHKHEIIKLGIELGAPLQLSWSCYQNSEKACGACDSCALRLRAFARAGVADPISYEGL